MPPLERTRYREIEVDDVPNEPGAITALQYDVWSLRVTLDFAELEGCVYLDFECPNGLRVLDESELPEILQDGRAPDAFLLEVERGGWLELESGRSGFTLTREDVKEYMVVGTNECVSVIATDEPDVVIIRNE